MRQKPRKAVVLIPLTYNDGSPIPRARLQAIHDEVYVAFHGWTDEGTVKGAYRMASGEQRLEKLKRVSIILDESEIPSLRRMIAAWAADLEQETILLEITESLVEFIPPLFEEE